MTDLEIAQLIGQYNETDKKVVRLRIENFLLNEKLTTYQKTFQRLNRQLVFFQGKFSMTKHENNKLRKENRRLKGVSHEELSES